MVWNIFINKLQSCLCLRLKFNILCVSTPTYTYTHACQILKYLTLTATFISIWRAMEHFLSLHKQLYGLMRRLWWKWHRTPFSSNCSQLTRYVYVHITTSRCAFTKEQSLFRCSKAQPDWTPYHNAAKFFTWSQHACEKDTWQKEKTKNKIKWDSTLQKFLLKCTKSAYE